VLRGARKKGGISSSREIPLFAYIDWRKTERHQMLLPAIRKNDIRADIKAYNRK
jgi:hypothetical protein